MEKNDLIVRRYNSRLYTKNHEVRFGSISSSESSTDFLNEISVKDPTQVFGKTHTGKKMSTQHLIDLY